MRRLKTETERKTRKAGQKIKRSSRHFKTILIEENRKTVTKIKPEPEQRKFDTEDLKRK